MSGTVLLINTNIVRPLVSPIGLEYVGEALINAKIPVQVLDLAFEDDWRAALTKELRSIEPLVVGVSVRNTDDTCFATRRSFLPWIGEVIAGIRRSTQTFILLGGVGFSVMPEACLRLTEADAGIAGDGEETVVSLVRCLMNGEEVYNLPNLVYRREGDIICNRRVYADLERLPAFHRQLFDSKKYESLGAMVGVETKRGCSRKCIFCADPVAKGSSFRLRPPMTVVQEFQNLLAQGVSWFHLCDSEFNLPITHAKDVCRALVQTGLGDRLNWYCYCSPTPFDRELADLMKRAGCAGVNFGVDSLSDEQLSRLGCSHSVSDVERLVTVLNQEGLDYMFDFLVGGPGETEETVKTTIEHIRRLDVPLAGMAAGVRVYPGTQLSRDIASGRIRVGLYPEASSELDEPLFYLSPHLDEGVFHFINEIVADDPRFLSLAAPTEEGSYNYADDEALSKMIEAGARGAYWHIISESRRKADLD